VLTDPMLDQLGQLGLSGMAQAFAELEASDETATLTHADWLGVSAGGEQPRPADLVGAGHSNAAIPDNYDCAPWSGPRTRFIAGMPHSA
jgi:hypothetical protein